MHSTSTGPTLTKVLRRLLEEKAVSQPCWVFIFCAADDIREYKQAIKDASDNSTTTPDPAVLYWNKDNLYWAQGHRLQQDAVQPLVFGQVRLP